MKYTLHQLISNPLLALLQGLAAIEDTKGHRVIREEKSGRVLYKPVDGNFLELCIARWSLNDKLVVIRESCNVSFCTSAAACLTSDHYGSPSWSFGSVEMKASKRFN